MYWIHISDIHFNFDGYDTEKMRMELLEYISQENFENLDAIFLTGDLRFAPKKEFKQETKDYIDSLLDSFNPKVPIYISAGNHDLDRSDSRNNMIKGIRDSGFEGAIIGTNIAVHPKIELQFGDVILADEIYDFCSKNYPYENGIDYIVMNPPFSLTVPFVNHALDIAKKGVLMFNRLQFIESQKRYDMIFKENPPAAIYQYVDRVNCAKVVISLKNKIQHRLMHGFIGIKVKQTL